MEGYSRKDDGCPQLLDLIPRDGQWVTKRAEETSHGVSEEKKLELTLGPPRGEWTTACLEREGLLSLGYFPPSPCLQNPVLTAPSPWQSHKLHPPYLHLQSGQGQVAVNEESSQPCSNRAAEQSAAAEKKAFSAAAANTAVHSSGSAQKRCLSFIFSLLLVFPFGQSIFTFFFFLSFFHFLFFLFSCMYFVVHAFANFVFPS